MIPIKYTLPIFPLSSLHYQNLRTMPNTYLGYRPPDQETPYARFFNEDMAPIPAHIEQGLAQSPLPAGTLPPVGEVAAMCKSGYAAVENGYSLEKNGAISIVALTSMPGVSPKMWHWWFGWHGCRANRYKLWHPKAHVDARWQDGSDEIAYVGRSSMIEEYIGKSLEKACIRFVDPSELGIDPRHTSDQNQVVFICARVGYRDYPIDFGYLVHQVRATPDGAEMRSRFWFGGSGIQLRRSGVLPALVSSFLQKIIRLPKQRGIDLMTHCAEEMNHLAKILPDLYAEFGERG
jgi:hypothetical protein